MKGFLIFILGAFVGAIFTLFILFVIGSRTTYSYDEIEVQYIDVKGKKGNVTLYTGMPKDSVLVLVGKPDKVDLRSTQSATFENWGYKIKNTYTSDLDLDFVNGRLEGVRQD